LAYLAYIPVGLKLAWATRRFFCTKKKIIKDTHPWLAIDLIVPHEITGIEIVERKDVGAERTNNIEVRVGDTKPFNAETSGRTRYSSNNVCGVFIDPGKVGGWRYFTQPLIG
jgi:hypothetical protein